MIFERVKYKMIDNDRGKFIWLANDPKGWDESDKTLKRSDKTFGVWTELSKNLEFVEEGADFLKAAKANKDIEANVTLEEWRMHPEIDKAYRHSVGTFDFSDWTQTELGVKVPFKTGGLNSLIKSQLREKFELSRTKSINEKFLGGLNKKTVGLEGREIFLVTTWDTDNNNKKVGEEGDKNTYIQLESNAGNTRGAKVSLPFKLIGQSHEGFAGNIFNQQLGDNSGLGDGPGTANHVFFLNSDLRRTFDLTFSYDYDVWFDQYEQIDWAIYRLSLVTYEGGESLNFKSRICIHELKTSNIGSYPGTITSENSLYANQSSERDFVRPLSGSYSDSELVLEAGESLGIEIWCLTDFQSSNVAGIRVYAQDVNCSLKIEEKSYFPPTTTNTVLMHEAGERLLEIVTGEKNKFKSKFYGRTELGYDENGEFSFTGLSQGFWIRGFSDLDIELSLNDYIKTANAIHNVGYTIQQEGEDEVFVLEEMKYFFQNRVTILLPNQVSNVKRQTAKEFYYSNMTFGYEKPSGDNLYEEALGLDEYNTKTSYTTPITRVDKKYEKISKARADSYGMEFARRKSKEIFPEEDTRYDKTVFLLDLKEVSGSTSLAERKWQDDFDEEPTGVFSPSTATNLRLTPYRISQRHEWFYSSGLRRFRNNNIIHSTSVGNSYLSTKLAGEDARTERDSFPISQLEPPRFYNEYIEFDYEVDFYVNEQVYGTTEIDGQNVPNYFGKVQFINEYGQKEYGYLFELKPNKEGKWKLLKAV